MCSKENFEACSQAHLVVELIDLYLVSEKRTCRVILICRTSWLCHSIRDEQVALHMRINEISGVRVRHGYKRIHVLLRREGWRVNHKKVYRIYCEEGLNLIASKPKRQKNASQRIKQPEATSVNENWSMGSVTDNLFNGHRFPVINDSR
jgi:putative transposase